MNLPKRIFSGYWGKCHCQGIAVDLKKGFIYYSFTTKLVKSKLDGTIVGAVDGLIGHLGCIDFNENDGKVYGSLEFKQDGIGKGILSALGIDRQVESAFYCAIFDVDKLDRPDMDAERDGIMRAVYLKDVVDDYTATVPLPHRYGCSGIDGTGWGLVPGTDRRRLLIAYGVYGDLARNDNDYQVLLCYDAADWWTRFAQPLDQAHMHQSGPAQAEARYFLYTGNTTYGVQNLEFEPDTGDWLAAVYPGQKPAFPNPPLFRINGAVPPKAARHRATGEPIEELTLLGGYSFAHGDTGVCALGSGYYYFSHHGKDPERGQYTTAVLYRATGDPKKPFEEA